MAAEQEGGAGADLCPEPSASERQAPSTGVARDAATPVVGAFYDRFPYPGDPLQDGPPPGYNWRWCVDSVRAFSNGSLPRRDANGQRLWRILDAGCGTGVSTDYLCHLNPGSEVLAVDISPASIGIARERTRRSGAASCVRDLRIELRSLLALEGEGEFDHINSVGVLHHLAQPQEGLRALAARLRPGGSLHLFLYAEAGRWEIRRVQRALALLDAGSGPDGLHLGRQLLRELPPDNRLRRHHEERWALDTAADVNFADMYLHPQESTYTIESLFALIRSSGLRFAGFSNPQIWDPARLLSGEPLARARALPALQQWSLVETLDPAISHFEFFLTTPASSPDPEDLLPLDPAALEESALLASAVERNRCLWGWPGTALLGPDLEPLDLEPGDAALLEAIDRAPAGTALAALQLAMPSGERAARSRRLLRDRVLLRLAG